MVREAPPVKKTKLGKQFLLDTLTREENASFISHEIITPEVTSDVREYKRISVTYSSHSFRS